MTWRRGLRAIGIGIALGLGVSWLIGDSRVLLALFLLCSLAFCHWQFQATRRDHREFRLRMAVLDSQLRARGVEFPDGEGL